MHDDPILDAMEQLNAVAPHEMPKARAELARFKASQPSRHIWRSTMTSTRKYAAVSVFAALIIGVFALFPSARAAASDMLGVFRVSKFAPISVSPQQLELLATMGEDGLYPGEFEFEQEPGEAQAFDTLSGAQSFIQQTNPNFNGLRTNYALGEPSTIFVQPGGSGTLTVNLENARAMLEAANVDPLLLPDSLDGQDVSAEVFNMIGQDWGDVQLMQMTAPVVDYPDDVNPAPIGAALLQLLGMDSAEAERLAANIDWTNTLLLPVPTEFATFAEVSVDGTLGLALEPVDGTGEAAILWQTGGMLYFMTGYDLGVEEMLDVAGDLDWHFE